MGTHQNNKVSIFSPTQFSPQSNNHGHMKKKPPISLCNYHSTEKENHNSLLSHFQHKPKSPNHPETINKSRSPTKIAQMGLNPILFFFSAIAIASASSPETDLDPNRIPDAYDIIKDYDFPIGILPKGVAGYDLDSSTGRFAAYFNSTCSFSLEGSYQLRYSSTIRGHISKGKLSGLEGVSVKLFLLWVNIVEVRRSGDDLEFSVGIAGADFPVDNFEECPQCGCGLNCNGAVGGSEKKPWKQLKRGSFVASS